MSNKRRRIRTRGNKESIESAGNKQFLKNSKEEVCEVGKLFADYVCLISNNSYFTDNRDNSMSVMFEEAFKYYNAARMMKKVMEKGQYSMKDNQTWQLVEPYKKISKEVRSNIKVVDLLMLNDLFSF